MFIWVLHIISHLGLDWSSTIANNFRKFQVMLLFSWMSWMSTTTKMTFTSINEMYIVWSIRKYNLPTRGLWIHTTSNVCTLNLTKRMTWHLTFLCPTKPWRMFFKSWMQLWKMNLHPYPLLFLFKTWNLLHKNQWSTNKFHWQVKCSKIDLLDQRLTRKI
jgi:hypothetical protein